MFGTSKHAVTNTPKTEPVVLIKKTQPAPASPTFLVDFICDALKATSRGFMDETVTKGTSNNIQQARKEPKIRSKFAKGTNRVG